MVYLLALRRLTLLPHPHTDLQFWSSESTAGLLDPIFSGLDSPKQSPVPGSSSFSNPSCRGYRQAPFSPGARAHPRATHRGLSNSACVNEALPKLSKKRGCNGWCRDAIQSFLQTPHCLVSALVGDGFSGMGGGRAGLAGGPYIAPAAGPILGVVRKELLPSGSP